MKKMELIGTITDSDLGISSSTENRPNYRLREAARAVLLDTDSRIALMHVPSDNYFKLPGGGLDAGEEAPKGLSRELLEEVGASSIDIIQNIGQVDEYRDQYEMIGRHYCYVVKLTGPLTSPARTKKEIAEGYETVWVGNIDEAAKLVSQGQPEHYGHKFEKARELVILNRAKSLL